MLSDHGVIPWSLLLFLPPQQGLIKALRLILEDDVTQMIIVELNARDEVSDESVKGVGLGLEEGRLETL